MKSIVISLKDNNELRRNHITNEFKKSNVKFEFFDAITPDQIANTEHEIGIDLSDSKLSQGARACLLSHLKVWQIATQNKSELVAVFEDDIHLSPNASNFLSDIKWIPSGVGIVKLEKYSKYIPRFNCKKIRTSDNRMLYEIKRLNLGAAGYIITKEAIEKILNRLSYKQNILDIDVEIFEPSLNRNINSLMIHPAICIQDFILNDAKNTIFTSSLNPKSHATQKKKKPLFTKVKKELLKISPATIIKKYVLSKKSTYR